MTIKYELDDGIATITLNRPDRLNAFTPDMAREFLSALERSDSDDAVRAVIVTGNGRAFSAGADLSKGAVALNSPKTDEGHVQRDFGGLMTLRLFECKKPVIAAVNGPAVGVGATMQLAMDVRIASTEAKFGFVFVKRGLVPEAASSWFLPRIVGISTALRWCLSGAMVDAEAAQSGGLVSSVHNPADLMKAARAIAREFVDGTAPVSVALTRRMLWMMAGTAHPMEAHILDSHALHLRGHSQDLSEGVAAYLEKREAAFVDRVSEVDGNVFCEWEPRPFQ